MYMAGSCCLATYSWKLHGSVSEKTADNKGGLLKPDNSPKGPLCCQEDVYTSKVFCTCQGLEMLDLLCEELVLWSKRVQPKTMYSKGWE